MSLRFDSPSSLQYFATLVQSDEHLPLMEAAVCIAQDEFPELDIQAVLADIDQMQLRLARHLVGVHSPLQRLKVLNQFFFGEMGFGGNVNNYYAPENSYIPVVLATRRGIPVSVALIWLELAQAAGLQASGVAFPGHFLLKVGLPEGQVIMDPLTGISFSAQELAQRLEPFGLGRGRREDAPPLGLHLQAATPRDILERLLRNLKEIYFAQSQWALLTATLDRLIVLLPDDWAEYRDRGAVLAEQGRTREAVADWETYLRYAGDRPDAELIARRLAVLRG
ncbi:tetratricopeptide repeat protein [Acidovorax sp. Be4]|uniref:Tetratricopeptide repeat protein n=1 Tax=Acidovorax bellezanensis TaxID=2976702 RepID=A0ABT2PKP8_9BURK|nr:tetratricopeptide repeat protein [Acidovorax sp. Be4]MCT9809812.1 tetratricopeptide repeat protein [Acidovorax sp. Be4]